MTNKLTKRGIVDISVQLSKYSCSVKDLAEYFNIDEGKLTVGLGLSDASACALNEDSVTLGLTAIKKLLERNNLTPSDISKLEVGTESNWDGSKSFKTYFMTLFKSNTNIGGCDTTNACYGGTNALLNALFWAESSFWDGKYAIVVCTDTCLYNDKNLVPLAGSAAVAILIGKNPVFKFYQDSLIHYFSNTYDFSKPKNLFPYPFLNGKMSVEIYKKAFSDLFEKLKSKFSTKDFFDHVCFHTPYPKLPEKLCKEYNIDISKVEHSLNWCRKVGNPYTASLYLSLSSLLFNTNVKIDDKILMFSFGSGVASSIFLMQKVRDGICKEDVFLQRETLSADNFVKLLSYEERRKIVNENFKLKKGFVVKEENEAGKVYEFLQ